MQKNIIALAVAGLMSGAAFAQSNVTVYGEVDLGYLRGTTAGSVAADTKTGIQSGVWASSRLGFKGEEALGNGLKAIFTLEYGLTSDVNTGVGAGTPGREQSLGLVGDFGTVKAGRLTTLGHGAANKYDPMRATSFAPLSSFRADSISNSSRLSNTVTYMSTNKSGFTFGGMYAFQGSAGNDTAAYGSGTDQERVLGFTVDYTNGPLAVGYVHHRINDFGAAGTVGGNDVRENFVGASYDFGAVKLLGSYQTNRRDNDSRDLRVLSAGVQVPVSAMSRVDFGYASAKDRDLDTKGTSWGIQYSYDMSKRTMAFAGYQRVSNNDSAYAALGTTNGIGSTDNRSTGLGFGLRHKF